MLALLLAVHVCTTFENYSAPKEAVAAYALCDDDENECELRLAERFANGDGVKRDYRLAEYFLCQSREWMVVAEFDNMLEHIGRMRRGETTDPLAYCENVTSSGGYNRCTAERYTIEMPELRERVDKFRTATAVIAKARKFIELAAESAYESGGMARQSMSDAEELALMEELAEFLELYSQERAPGVTIEEAKKADDELNAAYRVLNGDEYEIPLLRETQRAWIAYRDAFAKWYVARWKSKADASLLRREIVTAMTIRRTRQLR